MAGVLNSGFSEQDERADKALGAAAARSLTDKEKLRARTIKEIAMSICEV